MIATKQQLLDTLNYEKRLYRKKRFYLFRPVLSESSIAWKYVCLLRYEEFFTNTNHKLMAFIFRFIKVLLGRKYSIQIPINVVDPGLLMYHPMNIVINAAHIGKNCSIQFGVSMVAGGHDGSIPTIGNDVTIGAASVIIGSVYIADGIAIGANSTVTKTFREKNICIAGSPAKKISDNGSKTWGGSPQNVLSKMMKT